MPLGLERRAVGGAPPFDLPGTEKFSPEPELKPEQAWTKQSISGGAVTTGSLAVGLVL